MNAEPRFPCVCGPLSDCPLSCPRRKPKQRNVILGIDPGMVTGWCLYSPDGPVLHGLYDLPREGRDDLGAQLAGFKFWLEDMLADHRPLILALERPFGRAAFTSDLPGTLCGLSHMIAHCHMTQRREFTASAVKKAMTGNGKASKGDVIAAVRSTMGIDVISNHAADAAAVAFIAWNQEAQRGRL